jgi:hypothetical protein
MSQEVVNRGVALKTCGWTHITPWSARVVTLAETQGPSTAQNGSPCSSFCFARDDTTWLNTLLS